LTHFSGRCVCSKVTYAADADPVFSGICHCRTCQRAAGSAFGAVVAVPEASLTVSGTLKTYDGIGDSGKATHRGFCPECGSSITMRADIMPGIVMLTIGTLDDPGLAPPSIQIFCDSAQPWLDLPEPARKFPKMPM
jgi:hypothetical protein